jgi:hypothetical protein
MMLEQDYSGVSDTPVGRALRKLQMLDEIQDMSVDGRALVLQAQTLLGEELGLDCTGEEAGWRGDGSAFLWDHNSGTCPIHEWLVPADNAGRETT